MRKLPKYLALAAVSMAATAALPASSQAQDRDQRGDSTDIIDRAEDLPREVRRTIERVAVGTNHFIDRRDRDDKVRYVVHYTDQDGRRTRIRVDERGELIEEPNPARVQIGGEVREERAQDEDGRSPTVEEDELPDRVRRAFDKFREGTHDPVFARQERDGKTFYTVHYTTAASERMWVRVAENGEVAEGPHISLGTGISGLRMAGVDDRGDRAAARADRRSDRRADRRADRIDPADTDDMRRAEIGADELPANIRRLLEEKTAGGTRHRFFRETDKGRRTYFVEYAKGEKQFQVRVDERGEVLIDREVTAVARADEPAEDMRRAEIGADELPGNLRRLLEEKTAGGTDHRFFRETRGGQRTYFVEYNKNGQPGSLRVDERGNVVAEQAVAGTPRPTPQPPPVRQSEEEADLAAADAGPAGSHVMVPVGDLPAEVRQAFEQQTKGGTEHIVQRRTQEGRTLYTANYRTADDEHNIIVVDDRGQVVVKPRKSRWLTAQQKGVRFEPVPVEQLPAEIRQTIEKQAPKATEHVIVRRVRPEGEPTYLVQFTNAKGRRQQMEVNANGKVREEIGAAQENPFRMAARQGERERN